MNENSFRKEMIKITRANRRYYWLQLKEDFFKTKEMKLMRKLPGGEEITIIYLKIMLVSLADEGKIFFEGLAEDLAEELSLLIDEDAEAVRMALIFLEQKKLLTTSDNYQYNLEQVPEMIGSETASARRVRKHRDSQKALHCNTEVTNRNGDIDIEIDKDLKTSGIRINEKQHQQLLEYVGIDGMSFDMLNRAIEITSGVHQPSFNYLKAILEKWKENGFTSLEQVDEHEEERRSSKNSASKTRIIGNTIEHEYQGELPF